MILSFISIHKVPRDSQGPSGRLKTSGFAPGFQHFPRDLGNVNEWKIMFDPFNKICILDTVIVFDILCHHTLYIYIYLLSSMHFRLTVIVLTPHGTKVYHVYINHKICILDRQL